VQLACLASGMAAPRDSDMMEAYLGKPLDHMDIKRLQAGDLIFWKGHTAMMVDEMYMIHANGHHMQTVVEPVEEAISRIAYMYDTPTSFRRLF
ncbi:MAG: C40 family peptidase, partial [Hyphomicrobiales bacterium]